MTGAGVTSQGVDHALDGVAGHQDSHLGFPCLPVFGMDISLVQELDGLARFLAIAFVFVSMCRSSDVDCRAFRQI